MLLLVAALSCTEEKASQTDVYIYLDYTEGQDYSAQIAEDMDKYLALMEVAGEQSRNYGAIKVYPLHDISAGVSKTVKLKEGKSQLEGNKFLRKKEVDAFTAKLTDKMLDINTNFTGKELTSSHIFTPICKGVKKLNKSDADKKIILIYSDMLENSELANFHSKSITFESLKANFDKSCDMDDTSEIEFYIVHPVNKKNDQKIRKASDLWAKYLLDKGMDEDAFHFDTGIDI